MDAGHTKTIYSFQTIDVIQASQWTIHLPGAEAAVMRDKALMLRLIGSSAFHRQSTSGEELIDRARFQVQAGVSRVVQRLECTHMLGKATAVSSCCAYRATSPHPSSRHDTQNTKFVPSPERKSKAPLGKSVRSRPKASFCYLPCQFQVFSQRHQFGTLQYARARNRKSLRLKSYWRHRHFVKY
jgi:hypothetical protein